MSLSSDAGEISPLSMFVSFCATPVAMAAPGVERISAHA
jgi:hypothetical protein